MAAPSSMTRLIGACRKFEHAFIQWIGLHPPPGFQGALACNLHPLSTNNKASPSSKSLLEEIFDGMLLAVPKSRRTLEKRRTRKMSFKGHFEYAIPKTNIISCLNCGNWHERNTICGHCYERVKDETEEMQEAMGEDIKYDAPRSEVVFLYDGEGDVQDTFNGKHIVEMKKCRPEWFPKNLMAPGHSQGDGKS